MAHDAGFVCGCVPLSRHPGKGAKAAYASRSRAEARGSPDPSWQEDPAQQEESFVFPWRRSSQWKAFWEQQLGLHVLEKESVLLQDVQLLKRLGNSHTYAAYWQGVPTACKFIISHRGVSHKGPVQAYPHGQVLLESLLSRSLAHPRIVSTYEARSVVLTPAFVAACEAANAYHARSAPLYSKPEGDRSSREVVQSLVTSVKRRSDELGALEELERYQGDRANKREKRGRKYASTEALNIRQDPQLSVLIEQWSGLTPLIWDMEVKSSMPSSAPEEFGYEVVDTSRVIPWAELLHELRAAPGDCITLLISRHCGLGTLQTVAHLGLFHADQENSTWSQSIRDWALVCTLREIAQALEHIHGLGVVHGGIKASNVFLVTSSADKRGFTVVLSNFSTASVTLPAGAAAKAKTKSRLPPSPTAASDLHAFGMLMWSLTASEHAATPFATQLDAPSTSRSSSRRQAPAAPSWPEGQLKELGALYDRCVTHDPQQRPTALQLVLDLLQLEAQLAATCKQ